MANLIFSLASLLACDGAPPQPQVVAPPLPPAETILLARHPERVTSLSVSPRNRAGTLPETFPPLSGWLPGEITGSVAEYFAATPTMGALSPALPEGFAVIGPDGRPLRFVRDGSGGPGSWSVSGDHIRLHLPTGTNPVGYQIRHPDATARLARFNFSDSGLDTTDFVHRTERIKSARHYGVFLPAPAHITWSVTVPKDGRLTADAALLRSPSKAEQVSDGVTLIAEVLRADGVEEVARLAVGAGKWEDLEADLSAWAGQEVELRLRVDPGESNLEDYLMVGEPMLYTPLANPRRIIVFFADTLRSDHMGVYGYDRDTTPNIDRWASGAAVFDEVRSVAPWTYPAARTILSGRMPDRWDAGPVLPERLAEAGWSTIAFTNNAYLSRFFGMDRGWSWHFYEPTLDARGQAHTLAAALEKNTDRDTLFLVQLMDVHLPYAEPEPYRTLYTERDLPGLPDPIQRGDVLAYTGDMAEAKGYLIDRYDQSLRYLDRAIAPIFERLDDNDTVIFLSDHGEEFWEHDGFEHGHTLFEELLQVPLIIHGPSVPAGRVDAPASLLDVTPTILDIAGLDPGDGLQGTSLLGAARQEEAALDALRSRPQGFGFVLYDEGGWGAWADGQKWVTQGGHAQTYDLRTDPGEQSPTVLRTPSDHAPWISVASSALQRPVGPAWRLMSAADVSQRPQEVHLSAPGGLSAAWASLESPNIPPPEVIEDEGAYVFRAAGGGVLPRELFARPVDPTAALTVRIDGESQSFLPDPGFSSGEVGTMGGVAVGVAVTAAPAEALQTTASSVESQLRALGYLE